jgi:hypothetical protein
MTSQEDEEMRALMEAELQKGRTRLREARSKRSAEPDTRSAVRAQVLGKSQSTLALDTNMMDVIQQARKKAQLCRERARAADIQAREQAITQAQAVMDIATPDPCYCGVRLAPLGNGRRLRRKNFLNKQLGRKVAGIVDEQLTMSMRRQRGHAKLGPLAEAQEFMHRLKNEKIDQEQYAPPTQSSYPFKLSKSKSLPPISQSQKYYGFMPEQAAASGKENTWNREQAISMSTSFSTGRVSEYTIAVPSLQLNR